LNPATGDSAYSLWPSVLLVIFWRIQTDRRTNSFPDRTKERCRLAQIHPSVVFWGRTDDLRLRRSRNGFFALRQRGCNRLKAPLLANARNGAPELAGPPPDPASQPLPALMALALVLRRRRARLVRFGPGRARPRLGRRARSALRTRLILGPRLVHPRLIRMALIPSRRGPRAAFRRRIERPESLVRPALRASGTAARSVGLIRIRRRGTILVGTILVPRRRVCRATLRRWSKRSESLIRLLLRARLGITRRTVGVVRIRRSERTISPDRRTACLFRRHRRCMISAARGPCRNG